MTVLEKTAWRLTYNDGRCREVVNVVADTIEQAQKIAASYFTCLYGQNTSESLHYQSATTFEIIQQAE